MCKIRRCRWPAHIDTAYLLQQFISFYLHRMSTRFIMHIESELDKALTSGQKRKKRWCNGGNIPFLPYFAAYRFSTIVSCGQFMQIWRVTKSLCIFCTQALIHYDDKTRSDSNVFHASSQLMHVHGVRYNNIRDAISVLFVTKVMEAIRIYARVSKRQVTCRLNAD